jgi:hypothetical protein
MNKEMRYQDFLNKVIDESIIAAKKDYTDPDKKHMLEGSVAGLKACRDLDPVALAHLLQRSHRIQMMAFHTTNINRYWRLTCFSCEVEWVCNVVSAALSNMGMDPIIPYTARGLMMAARVVNGEFVTEGN